MRDFRDLEASDESRLKALSDKVGNSIIALSYEAKLCGVTRWVRLVSFQDIGAGANLFLILFMLDNKFVLCCCSC